MTLGCPLKLFEFYDYGDGEGAFSIILDIMLYQLKMVLGGFLVRGGMTVNPLHMSANCIIGTPIVEAYSLESVDAIYPRIIMSQGVMRYIEAQLQSYATTSNSPHNSHILIDHDGEAFINYLYCLFECGFSKDAIIKDLTQHKAIITEKIEKYLNNEIVIKKLIWLANYHDFFCEKYFKKRKKLLIDIPKKFAAPRYLKDFYDADEIRKRQRKNE